MPPIAARAIVEMGKEFFLKDNDIPGYRQNVILRITNEAREQGALLTIRDLVRLLET